MKITEKNGILMKIIVIIIIGTMCIGIFSNKSYAVKYKSEKDLLVAFKQYLNNSSDKKIKSLSKFIKNGKWYLNDASETLLKEWTSNYEKVKEGKEAPSPSGIGLWAEVTNWARKHRGNSK